MSTSSKFTPFDNESDVLTLGNLAIENRTDRLTLMGDVELTRDKQGLQLAKQLQAVINDAVKTLEAQADLPDEVVVEAPQKMKNPFA